MSKIADDGTLKLTWDDLLIESADPERAREWFELWEISGRVRLVFLNKFGWIFFERAEGRSTCSTPSKERWSASPSPSTSSAER